MQETKNPPSTQSELILISDRLNIVFHLFWGLLSTLSVFIFIAGLPLRYKELTDPVAEIFAGISKAGISIDVWAIGMLGSEVVLMLGCVSVGFLLYFQRRKEIAIFFTSLLLITFGTGILNVLNAFSRGYPLLEPAVRFQKAVLWSLLLLVFYIFPNGKFKFGWTRWSYALWLIWTWSWFFFPESAHNPTRYGAFTTPWMFVIYMSWLLSGVAVLFLRDRNTPFSEERQQTKWVIAGFAGAVFVTLIEELPSMLNNSLMDRTTPNGIIYALVSTIIFTLGMLLVPATIGFSIQRKRLWQIDYLISRGLVYGLMALLVILGLFGSFNVLIKFFQAFNTTQDEWMFLLISALIVFSLFIPVFRLVQTIVDQKIYGIQIPYQKLDKRISQKRTPEMDWTGRTVGRYQILKLLRSGKAGRVYRGIEKNTGKPVAVKFLHQHLAIIPENRKSFVAEAKTFSKLDHPNISKMLDYGEEGETTRYIVMEFISDQTLADKLSKEGPFSVEQAKYVLVQLASALDYAHQQGVIHLDVKPGNILLRPNSESSFGYTPILTDFGISRALMEDRGIIFSGVTGTFDYISPEQIHSPHHLNGQSDIYSLGVVMYQMVTGQLPFQKHQAAAMLIAHLNQPPPNPMTINPEVSLKTAFAIHQAMAKNPSERFEKASLFAQAIL